MDVYTHVVMIYSLYKVSNASNFKLIWNSEMVRYIKQKQYYQG